MPEEELLLLLELLPDDEPLLLLLLLLLLELLDPFELLLEDPMLDAPALVPEELLLLTC